MSEPTRAETLGVLDLPADARKAKLDEWLYHGLITREQHDAWIEGREQEVEDSDE